MSEDKAIESENLRNYQLFKSLQLGKYPFRAILESHETVGMYLVIYDPLNKLSFTNYLPSYGYDTLQYINKETGYKFTMDEEGNINEDPEKADYLSLYFNSIWQKFKRSEYQSRFDSIDFYIRCMIQQSNEFEEKIEKIDHFIENYQRTNENLKEEIKKLNSKN
eukprot:TRINITY_DN7713_c0_g1_i1.p1 TRINITY_DN7713_c0_g1~~TRINITY_DN7713_c0_g1_i1.p1  ORF type:complete len:164 (+),score=35.14 TRINITY_DN7713_c0_g1_i1:42-533(+)